jgi:hypothetical protein
VHKETGAPQSAAAVVEHPIEGKVAAILNELDLAINRGGEHGVTRGMRFEVMEPTGVMVTDPDTGKPLGEETQVKIKVKVVRVESDYSVARSDEEIPGKGGSLFWASDALLKGTPARLRTLATDDALFPALDEEESFIKRGDPVREIEEEV